MIIERLVYMQVEDAMVSFDRENGETIIYPLHAVPVYYKEGNVIKAIVHCEDNIEFLELDEEEMERRATRLAEKKARLRHRARQSTNNA